MRAGSPCRHRHLPLHRHRGLDAAAPRARPGRVCGRARGAPATSCEMRSRRTAGSRSTRRATPSSSPSRPRPAPPRPRARRRTSSRPGRSRCAWACTRARRPSPGEGYVGVDVHRGARVGALAHGGQIVCSPATAALLDGRELRDLGLHRLKDFDSAIRLYQLGAGDVPGRFGRLERRPADPRDPLPRTRARALRGRVARLRARPARADDPRPWRNRQDALRPRARPPARRGSRRRHRLRAARAASRPRPRAPDDRRPARRRRRPTSRRSLPGSARGARTSSVDNLEHLLPDAARPLGGARGGRARAYGCSSTSREPLRVQGEHGARPAAARRSGGDRRSSSSVRARCARIVEARRARRRALRASRPSAARPRARRRAYEAPLARGAARAARRAPRSAQGHARRRRAPRDPASDDRLVARPPRRGRADGSSGDSRSSAAAARSRPPRRSARPTSTRSRRFSTRASSGAARAASARSASGCSRRSASSPPSGSRARVRPTTFVAGTPSGCSRSPTRRISARTTTSRSEQRGRARRARGSSSRPRLGAPSTTSSSRLELAVDARDTSGARTRRPKASQRLTDLLARRADALAAASRARAASLAGARSSGARLGSWHGRGLRGEPSRSSRELDDERGVAIGPSAPGAHRARRGTRTRARRCSKSRRSSRAGRLPLVETQSTLACIAWLALDEGRVDEARRPLRAAVASSRAALELDMVGAESALRSLGRGSRFDVGDLDEAERDRPRGAADERHRGEHADPRPAGAVARSRRSRSHADDLERAGSSGAPSRRTASA